MTHETPPTAHELANATRVLQRQPKTRKDCPPDDTPCPFVACKYHLWTDIVRGRFVRSHAFGDCNATCVLRFIDANPHGMTLEAIGDIYGLSREWFRQIEERAMDCAAPDIIDLDLRDWQPEESDDYEEPAFDD